MKDLINKLRISNGTNEVYSSWFTVSTVNDIIYKIKYINQPRLDKKIGRRIETEISIEDIIIIVLISKVLSPIGF